MLSSSVHIFCNIQLAQVKSRNSLQVSFISFISITLLHNPESTYTFVTKQLRSLNAIDSNEMSFFFVFVFLCVHEGFSIQ